MKYPNTMKNLMRGVAPLAATILALPALAESPVARPEAVVTSGNARFTVLTPEMIRIEYSDKGIFEDRATFTIQNREMESVPRFTKEEDAEYLTITTDAITLRYRKGTNPKTVPASPKNLTVTLNASGTAAWYPGKPDPLNLKGTCRTLDGSNGDNKRAELEDGLISRSGWAVIDDSWTAARPDGSRSFALQYDDKVGYDWWADREDPHAIDLYFMGYGHNYKKALSDFTKVAGKIPLPPDYVFGYWYSRYASYSSDDYRQLMTDLESNDIPTDVMILDMDWHWNGDSSVGSGGKGGWTGWSWNTNLIPEPAKLLDEIHNRGYRLSLNLHPADGINSYESPDFYNAMKNDLGGRYDNDGTIAWSLDYSDFAKTFFDNVIRTHENEGVDFWWIDWQQHLTSPYTQGLGETFWCNHVFFNDMKHNRPDRRPVIFHRWGGLGSHRYQIGFSGDALINFPTLGFQPYFTSTASNVGYAYWGHDLGGHAFTDENIVNNPELMLRWIQFGVFTPIFRSHATKDDRIERRMWKFENFADMRDAVKLRYALFPYLYTQARNTYETGLGICRPMYYEFPDTEEAYSHEGQYMFGDDILVAPVTEMSADGKTSTKEIWFPDGYWYDVNHNHMIQGPVTESIDFAVNEIPYFYRAGAMIPLNPASVNKVTARSEEMIIHTSAGASGLGFLYEDGGDNSDYEKNYSTTPFTHTVDGLAETYAIHPRENHGNVSGTRSSSVLPENRSWTMLIHNAVEPVSVKLNDAELDASQYEFNPEKRILTVKIPSVSSSQASRLDVKYSVPTGISQVDATQTSIRYDRATDSIKADFRHTCANVNLSLINMAGVECLHRDYSHIDSLCENIAHLSSDIYICRLMADNEVITEKICK